MQEQPVRQLDVGIIAEPTAAHLDLYLETIASCRGIGAIAYAGANGGTPSSLPAGMRRYNSPEMLLSDFRPALAIILLEAAHAPRWISAALCAACHILTEKHPAARLADFEPLVLEAEARGLRLELAFTTRNHPAVLKARELLRDGGLGRLYAADVVIVTDQTRLRDPQYRASWRADPERSGGGFLMAQGIHYLDLLLHLTGSRVARVCGLCNNAGGQPVRIEDSVAAALHLDNGGLVTFHGGYYLESAAQSGITLWTSDGWLRLEVTDGGSVTWYRDGDAAPQSWCDDSDFAERPMVPFFEDVIEAIRGGQPPSMKPRYGLHVLQTAFAIYQSAADGAVREIR